jgi:ribosomal protein L10
MGSTVQEVIARVKPQAEELLKSHDKQRDLMQEIMIKLDDEIAKKNERMIRHHVKALEKSAADTANRVSRVGRLLEQLEELDVDPKLTKEADHVEKLTAALTELERKLTKNYGVAKRMLDKGKDVLEADEATVDAAEATHEWAVMEAWLRKQLDLAKKRLAQMTVVRENARKALAGRDSKALAQAIKASTALVDAKPTLQEVQDQYADFCTECAKKLTQDQQDELARDRKTFDAIVEEIISLNGKILAADVEIGAMEVRSIDIKKVAALFKIPPTHEAKLKRALECEGPAIVKALDALAKELKLKTTGRNMLETINKL